MKSERDILMVQRSAFRVPRTRTPRLRRAFTLFEVLIALCLAIVLVSALMVFYAGALETRDRGSKVAADAIQARAMLNRIVEELRQSLPLVLGDGKGFQGTKDSITIVLTRLPDKDPIYHEYTEFDTLPPAQTDLKRVTYHLYWDEEERKDDDGIIICYGVWRTEQTTFDPNPKLAIINENPDDQQDQMTLEFPQPVGELYAPEIKFLRFEYYDGVKWRDRWNMPASATEGSSDSGGGDSAASSAKPNSTCVLPQAVRITIGHIRQTPEEQTLDMNQLKAEREERERREHHSDRFTVVVYLPQSDHSLLSSRKKGSRDDKDEMGETTSGGK